MYYGNDAYHDEAKDGHYHGDMDNRNNSEDFEVDEEFSEMCCDHL